MNTLYQIILTLAVVLLAALIHYLAGGWYNVLVSFSCYGVLIILCSISYLYLTKERQQ